MKLAQWTDSSSHWANKKISATSYFPTQFPMQYQGNAAESRHFPNLLQYNSCHPLKEKRKEYVERKVLGERRKVLSMISQGLGTAVILTTT